MMKPLSEALNCWCPMARVVQSGAVNTSGTYNRTLIARLVPSDAPPGKDLASIEFMREASSAANCIGPRCMLWVWAKEERPRRFVPASNLNATAEADAGLVPSGLAEHGWEFAPFSEEHPAGWWEPNELWAARRLGFCGLAIREVRE